MISCQHIDKKDGVSGGGMCKNILPLDLKVETFKQVFEHT